MYANANNLNAMMLRRRASAAPDPILALFASGEQGWYFKRDASEYFQLSDGTTVAANTDPVGYIGDTTANGNNATQVDAARRGLLTAQGVEFDGVDDHYLIDSTALGLASGSNTFVGVVRNDGLVVSIGDHKFANILNNEIGDAGFSVSSENGKLRTLVMQLSGFSRATATTLIDDGLIHIVSGRYDRAAQRLIIRLDGATEADVATADEDKTTTGSSAILGDNIAAGRTDTQWEGLIGDNLQIARALSDAEIDMVEQEFAARWGVTLA